MQTVTLKWRNFRNFRSDFDVRLPRLTVLIGPNNAGKSSVYAPLLLLKQTLDATQPETALLARGPLLDLGTFRDYINDHDVTKALGLRIGFDSPKKNSDPATPSIVEMEFGSCPTADVFLTKYQIRNNQNANLISRSRRAPGDSFVFQSSLLPSANNIGRPYREITEVRRSLREEQPTGFMFQGHGGLLLPRRIRENPERWNAVREWYNAAYRVFDVQSEANRRIWTFLKKIAYIGPLRSLPKRTYHHAPEPPSNVGILGENAIELLRRTQDAAIPSQVNEWLEKLKYGRVDFEEVGEEYFQAYLENARGLRVNIADTGVGLSQVVPLLVQGQAAEPGSMLILQQPEIHLNPAQQTVLADYVIDRAESDIRVLVETHSEHVLLRIRRRIAEGRIDADEVAVYYVESHEGRSRVRRIPIGEQGELSREDWPQGFFEGQLDDAFALAMAQNAR